MSGDPLDELFHWAALVAYLEVATARRAWPHSEEVRRRAFDLYEAELRAKNADRSQVIDKTPFFSHVVETTPGRE